MIGVPLDYKNAVELMTKVKRNIERAKYNPSLTIAWSSVSGVHC